MVFDSFRILRDKKTKCPASVGAGTTFGVATLVSDDSQTIAHEWLYHLTSRGGISK